VLRFALFNIPVVVHWWFWLTSAALGGILGASNLDEWLGAALFMCVAFLSILTHEMAHAVVGRRFGARPAVLLHGLGGLTQLSNSKLTRSQSVWVSLAGPVAGIALGLIVLGLRPWIPVTSLVGARALEALILVNLGWSVFNLLPILPMDGGQILRDLAGPRRARLVRWTGLVVAVLVCGAALMVSQWFLAILFGILAWQNLTDERRIPGGVVRQ